MELVAVGTAAAVTRHRRGAAECALQLRRSPMANPELPQPPSHNSLDTLHASAAQHAQPMRQPTRAQANSLA